MPSGAQEPLSLNLSQQRFTEFLEQMAEAGISQNEVARRLGVPPQYISDVKMGRRTVTELFARRIEEEFDVKYSWLQGDDMESDSGHRVRGTAAVKVNRIRLPVFPHPIEGEPRSQRTWDGSEIEICGAAVARIVTAELPYVLRFGTTDRRGRLRKDDLVLISQEVSRQAEVQVVKAGSKIFLARRNGPTGWEPVAQNKECSGKPVLVGHCVGILWGSLNM